MAGFATVLIGFMLIIAGSVGEFWVSSDQSYAMSNGRDASWRVFLLGHPVLAVGTLLFGIATTHAQVFPDDVGMLGAVIGTCGALIPFFGALVFAVPFIWLGYLLWSGKYEDAGKPLASYFQAPKGFDQLIKASDESRKPGAKGSVTSQHGYSPGRH